MAITPRYDGSADAGGQSARQEANPTRIDVQLVPGMELSRLNSLHHDVSIAQSNGRYVVSLQDQVVASERDFELVWEPVLSAAPKAALFSEPGADGHYVMLMVMPPQERLVHDRPRELILVLDTSGSMFGQSLEQARESVLMALATLDDRDRFNVIEFDSQARSLYAVPVPASARHIGEAIEFVEQLEADGGTEIGDALLLALAGGDRHHLRQVVFITDGSVGNETSLFRQIEAQLGNARLFTVGIGPAPNAYFMRKAAQFGRGSYTFIGDTAQVTERMDELLLRLEHPAITDLCIDWPGLAETYPARLPDLYAGEPLVITARLDSLTGQADLCGQTPLDSWNQSLKLAADTPAVGVGALWARRKIDQLMDDLALGAAVDEIRPTVVSTALEHRLVSRYTSFVAVDKTPVRPLSLPLKSEAMAAIAGDGLSMHLPGTATDAHARLVFGAMLLLLGLVFGWRLRQDG